MLVLPFKDQKSADKVRKQLKELSHKIHKELQPVFTSTKIETLVKMREEKPPIINQQNVIYKFECGACDACYIGYTTRHLHQRIEEHKRPSSSIGKHLLFHHNIDTQDLGQQFSILRRCCSKFDCLIFEMLLIREFKPTLNVQSDSLKAKLFV